MTKYWVFWFFTSATTFLVPELYQLASGNPQNTLSAAIWRLEGSTIGVGDPLRWNFAHFMFVAVFVLLAVWLVGHFGWRIWA